MHYITPSFYPTTTVLIDDDRSILNDLIQGVDLEMLPHKMFVNPREGVHFINNDTYRQEFTNRLMVSDEAMEGESLNFKPHSLLKEIKTADRYHQVSVLIIDYEMPGMNGLEVCQQIQNPFVKKILLTGVADEGIAVEAFNKGLISRYIRKHAPDFLDQLQQALSFFQHEYFEEVFTLPLQALEKRPESTALVDPVFINYFNTLVQTHGIQEYYLVEGMGSFLMVGKEGTLYSLITLDEGLVDAYVNAASMDTLTPEQIQAIATHDLIPCYHDPFKAPYLEPEKDLDRFLHKPNILKGISKTFYTKFGQGFIQVDPKEYQGFF